MSTFWGGRCLGGTRPHRGRLTTGSSMDTRELDHRLPSREDERHAVARSVTLERFVAPAPSAPPNMFTTPRWRHLVRPQLSHPALRRRRGLTEARTGRRRTVDRPACRSQHPRRVTHLGRSHRAAGGACARSGIRRASRQSWAHSAAPTTRTVRCDTRASAPVEPDRRLSPLRLGGGARHEV